MRVLPWCVVCCVISACPAAEDLDGPDGSMRDAATYDAARNDAAHSDAAQSTFDAGAVALSEIIPQALYEEMFPNRNALYTYAAFMEAASHYPTFGAEGSAEQRRREVAAFLANASHETTGGWPTAPGGAHAWGLHFKEEVGCETGLCVYCVAVPEYPCVPGKTYHGRGPIQLSYNYNYGFFSTVLGIDLLADPDAITRDGVLAFRSALWFWMTPQSPKPSAHAVMTGQWTPSQTDLDGNRHPGFGMTVNIINGGLECGRDNDSRVADRIGFFTRYTGLLGVDVGSYVDCENMQSY